jgi:hypothetical protein
MTEEQKERFLTRFSRYYLREDAAEEAGITDDEATALLKKKSTRAILEDRIAARLAGDMLHRIRREYEAIAFTSSEDIRPGDRIRALEMLRHLAAESPGENGPTLIIRCEYV